MRILGAINSNLHKIKKLSSNNYKPWPDGAPPTLYLRAPPETDVNTASQARARLTPANHRAGNVW